MTDKDRHFNRQERLYSFPYHYLPTLDESGTIAIHKFLSWGLDYLTYMSFAVDLITHRMETLSLLDVGCGDGRLLNMVEGCVPHRVGVDLSERAILFAKAFNPDARFIVGDLSSVPGQFQTVTLIEVMEHIPDEKYPEFINKVAEKTRPDGRLIVSVPTTNVPLNRKHYRHYNLPLLRQHLSSTFSIESHWFLSRRGWRFRLWNWLLQNQIGIILPRIWRRAVWKLHRRYTYMASPNDGKHLLAVAAPVARNDRPDRE
jgi:SAM-dependent methyltransferase